MVQEISDLYVCLTIINAEITYVTFYAKKKLKTKLPQPIAMSSKRKLTKVVARWGALHMYRLPGPEGRRRRLAVLVMLAALWCA